MRSKPKSRGRKGSTLAGLLLSAVLLPEAVSANYRLPFQQAPILPPEIPLGEAEPPSETHEFSLRHIFHRGSFEHPDFHARLDIRPDTRLLTLSEDGIEEETLTPLTPLVASSNPLIIHRLADRRRSVIEEHMAAARFSGAVEAMSPSEWVMDTIPGPNVTDKQTVLTFAKMTANDYIEVPGTGEWETIHGQFNYSQSFGWQKDGLRGHIYTDKTNSTVVISLKGTSPALFDGAGTTTNDKENDNIFFSCCCGQGGSYLWRQACDCQNATYTANETCIVEAMNDENRYYKASIDLYTNASALYPGANVWLTGHSLGGAMTGLLGLTFGLPAVTFEAVPEALPAARLGLPSPPGHDSRLPQTRQHTGAFHFGHTADPVYMGTCNGINSICTWGGYAMESACHTGQMCVYDTVADKGWRVGIGTHKIRNVIADVLEVYDDVPPCAPEEECYDCVLWKFFRSNGSEITTTTTATTTSPTFTRTETCKTPGWWGCLDDSTTITTTSTTSTSTSTCKTPGWFGCNDPTTTTTMSTTSAYSTTSTCKTPGWFGCNDPTTTTAAATPGPTMVTTIPTATSTTCHHPGWLGCNDPTTTHQLPAFTTCATPGLIWGCWDEPTRTHAISPPPTSVPTNTHQLPASSTCATPGLIWGCWDKPAHAHAITPPSTSIPTITTPPNPSWG